MKRTDADGAVGQLFSDGLPGETPGTRLDASWLNNVQEEICKVIEEAGLTLDGDDRTQLYTAVLNLIAAAAVADLSDYETGIYTPTLAPAASGSVTMDATSDTLSYIRIGDKVQVFGTLVLTGASSPVGTLTMSLPFAAADLTDQAARVGTLIAATRVNYTTDDQQLMAIDAEGSAVLYFYLMTKEAGFVNHVPTGDEAYYINFSYYAA